MLNGRGDVLWTHGSDGESKLFVGFVKVFFDMTATMLKSTALVPYLIHGVLLNSSAMYRRWRAEYKLTLIGLFPVKRETCKGSEMSGEGRSESAHY